MHKALIIQLTGLVILTLLLAVMLPHYVQRLPEKVASQAQQHLHEQGMGWATVQSKPYTRDIIISGHASDSDAQQQAVHTAQSLWYVKQVENAITPSLIEPYTLHILWDGKAVSLDGYVSSDGTKTALINHIESTFGHPTNPNMLRTGAGSPDGWEDIIRNDLLPVIAPLQTASIRMTDQTIRFSGKAATTQEVESIRKRLRSLEEKGYDLTLNVVAMDDAAVVCQQEFNRLLSQGKIVFQSGGSTIDSKSNDLLQKLADAAIFCADSSVMITGHTDNVGSDENNLKLSEQRAKAVKGWLFNKGGVPLERLKTAGKGSKDPLADNDSEEGRAKNRRIEFIVEGI